MKNTENCVKTVVKAKSAIGYIRISKENAEGVSLDMQRGKIEQYAELNDLELKNIYCDTYSGKTLNRPEFQKLLDDLDNIEHIIIFKLDRISRKTLDVLNLVELFDKKNISFHSVQEKLDTNSAMGRFVLRTISSLAEMERDLISDRTKDALAKVRESKPLGGVGYGSSACFKNDKRVGFAENTKESKVLSKILSLRSDGATLKKIKGYLETNNIRTKRGGSVWYESVILRIIKKHI